MMKRQGRNEGSVGRPGGHDAVGPDEPTGGAGIVGQQVAETSVLGRSHRRVDAHPGHHPRDDQSIDPLCSQLGFEVGPDEAVRVGLVDDGLCREDSEPGVKFSSQGPDPEEASVGRAGVPHPKDRDLEVPGPVPESEGHFQSRLRPKQDKAASRKIVILNVDDDEGGLAGVDDRVHVVSLKPGYKNTRPMARCRR